MDVELKEQEPSEFLYHGTATRFLDDIMDKGLKPMSRLYVHLSKDIETALKVGKRHGNPLVLKICSGQMYKDGYKLLFHQDPHKIVSDTSTCIFY